MIKFKESNNPIFGGKKLDLDAIMPTTREHYPVYRPKDTWFGYCAWPSVCRDENGTLYALSSAFGSEHVCPFNKVAMYISKNNGKTWSPPIVVADTYLPDGHGGITYLGNGKLIINYGYMPGDIMFNENYTRIAMGEPRSLAKARCAYVDTYKDIRFTSDHMAVLGSVGILPMNKLIREDYMKNTLNWVWDNWNWGKTWGWDYPMTAMNATRLGEPEKAVGALLMDKRTNTYLVNGHNYQDSRLRCYLPGNGGLLTAVALMCAGWDGCEVENPGFPKDGTWNVRWEGLKPMP